MLHISNLIPFKDTSKQHDNRYQSKIRQPLGKHLEGEVYDPQIQHSTGGKSIISIWSRVLTFFVTLVTLASLFQDQLALVKNFYIKHNSISPLRSPLPVLEVFQVYPPVQSHHSSTLGDQLPIRNIHETKNRTRATGACRVLLMEHSFGFSYGKPFIGNYVPPKCEFNKVTLNFTVTSRGRQFDRLAILYLNDTEIYRTSTAEPTYGGIRWEFIKDVSPYMSLWKSPQKVIFDLGNLVNDLYTAPFNTTLTATFSLVDESLDYAGLIIPISARKGSESQASLFQLPNERAINTVSFPQNINRAVFSVSACGQATEEFWWANVLQSNTETFKDVTGTLYGFSPFREVQVLIDGKLAGVQWPFPVIFTGGVVPGLWRPIVGIDAFDLKEHEIDITPWLPILCDGNEHSFEIQVMGIDDQRPSTTLTSTVGNSWYVTGKIWLWLDEDPEAVTTGSGPTVLLPKPVIEMSSRITQNDRGINETLTYSLSVQRTLSISSLVTTQQGTHLSTWTQDLAVDNINHFTRFGEIQETIQCTTGLDRSTGKSLYSATYQYPLQATTSFSAEQTGNLTLDAILVQGLHLTSQGASVFAPSDSTTLSTTLNGSAHYFASPRARLSTGYGSTSQVLDYTFMPLTDQQANRFRYNDADKRKQTADRATIYHRNVVAVNGTVVRDIEQLNNTVSVRSSPPQGVTNNMVAAWGAAFTPRDAIGRGLGVPAPILAVGVADLDRGFS